mmetsp:Transcript_22789/g.37809  ORF Transcript_22789/g.37809 Transcript_22789/m.37809 type:complete len:228 (-) Transcript_22789:264-947(-)
MGPNPRKPVHVACEWPIERFVRVVLHRCCPRHGTGPAQPSRRGAKPAGPLVGKRGCGTARGWASTHPRRSRRSQSDPSRRASPPHPPDERRQIHLRGRHPPWPAPNPRRWADTPSRSACAGSTRVRSQSAASVFQTSPVAHPDAPVAARTGSGGRSNARPDCPNSAVETAALAHRMSRQALDPHRAASYVWAWVHSLARWVAIWDRDCPPIRATTGMRRPRSCSIAI